MEVRYHNRRPNPAVPYAYEATLESLAGWADFLVVDSAGGPETLKLVSAEVLRALGPKGFLINVSRGSVVDEEALVQALESGTIAGAGLHSTQAPTAGRHGHGRSLAKPRHRATSQEASAASTPSNQSLKAAICGKASLSGGRKR